ncbi:MAG: 1-acyl-sn-glycerol-3-phosphate acyltransferase [Bermanella sp.]|jgi:1-acyl-sn-glycerol-3-phosphate acyltransferase
MDALFQVLRYALVIVLMVPLLGGALLIAPFSSNAGWRLVRIWSQIALRIFGIEIETHYEGGASQLKKGGVIVGLNQQSIIDPSVGYAGLDQRFMSVWNVEYALIPFFGWVSFILGWVVIQQWPSQAKRQIDKAAQYVAQGGLVYLSAEGKRSADGALNPYKKGPVVMAIRAQAPIHPLYISGSRQCLPPGEWKIRPGKIVVRFLAPMQTAGLSYDDRDELLHKISGLGKSSHRRWANASSQ